MLNYNFAVKHIQDSFSEMFKITITINISLEYLDFAVTAYRKTI